ncbi:MAG: bifunctional riboflavin kinase/FMN adenylyltransferase, partial [Bacteroidota bacterium]
MRIYHELDNFQANRPVVTIGVFDGVHRGHKAIISQLVARAEELGGESVVVTLWPHPR